MSKIIRWENLTKDQQAEALARPVLQSQSSLKLAVAKIITDIKVNQDASLLNYTQQFDCANLSSILPPSNIFELASKEISQATKDALHTAYANIKAFHQLQYPVDQVIETMPGIQCELKHAAIERVGLYIPGGTAPLPSTVLMLGVCAQTAGCELVVLCTPPNENGRIPAEIVYAAELCGISQIFMCGGAQAVAAMAYGTESVPKVDKIFGPGNSFVTEAKQQVSLDHMGAAIDMPAGPSEVLVIADSTANPDFIAADLLSQAEHGIDSQAIFVCDDSKLCEQVQQAITLQLASLSRADIAQKALENSRFIVTESLQQSVAVSNLYGPEHLIVQTEQARELLPELKNAGSIFVGHYSPESAGDYASGTNHVLPTYGYARNYSSLGLLDFIRRYTVQELSYEGLTNLAPTITTLANAEGLDAHSQAVSIRIRS